MKTRWERYCELRRIDNWCIQNPRRADLLAIGLAFLLFAASQLLRLLLDMFPRLFR